MFNIFLFYITKYVTRLMSYDNDIMYEVILCNNNLQQLYNRQPICPLPFQVVWSSFGRSGKKTCRYLGLQTMGKADNSFY